MAASLKRIVSKAYRVIYKVYKKLRTQRDISRLYSEDNVVLRPLARAFKAVLEDRTSSDEKAWIDRIEWLRNELNASSTEITIVDYGAGSPDLELTAQEMYRGRVVTRTIGEVCRTASKPHMWAFLLFKLIREFRPSVCLELGTCLGISAAYQAAALELNRHGRLVTIEGAESLASLARKNFEKLGLERVVVRTGRFQDILGDVLCEQGHIDFAFIDGHHDKRATLAYFEQIYPFLFENALLVFDDISFSKGMKRAWSAIVADKRIKISADLYSIGICVVASSLEEKRRFKIELIEAK